MRSPLRFALGLLALGITVFGCKPAGPPPAPTDVTLKVPAMN
jgi:hypothetical protein